MVNSLTDQSAMEDFQHCGPNGPVASQRVCYPVSRRLRSVLVEIIKLYLKVNLYWIITLWILQICQQSNRTVVLLNCANVLSTKVCQIRASDQLESVVVKIPVIVAIGKMATVLLEYADHASCSCRVDADVARTMIALPTTFGTNCIYRVTR